MSKLVYKCNELDHKISIKCDPYYTVDEIVEHGLIPMLKAIGYREDKIYEAFKTAIDNKGVLDELC